MVYFRLETEHIPFFELIELLNSGISIVTNFCITVQVSPPELRFLAVRCMINKEIFFCIFASHVILRRNSSWYLCFLHYFKRIPMLPLSYSSKRQSFHSSPSSANFSNMSFGTGRVYVKSQNCLVMTAGIVMVSLVLIVYATWGGRMAPYNVFRRPTEEYGVMIDAGSTGSRVHVYKFFTYGSSQPILQDEVFEQVKPGLSSYAENPDDGVESIKSLLDIAKNSIPEELWSRTPVALKATAGLRLLPQKQSEALLDKVDDLFEKSPFKVAKEPVTIMGGIDEGIFAWLTVNFLLSLIGEDTVGTIDLGGGSMQIAFSPVEKKTIDTSPEGFIHETSVFNNDMQVYVHSYLGLGLMSARELVLSWPKSAVGTGDTTSSCMPASYNGVWKNAQSIYNIKGDKSGDGKFDACHEVAKNAIAGKINRPDELKRETFYAFSYFFDRASENGLIHPEDGGVIAVQKFEETARKVCDEGENKDMDSPFMCMDLTIITTFLRDGYGFSPDTLLEVRKKIKGKENSWALGATFFLMTES